MYPPDVEQAHAKLMSCCHNTGINCFVLLVTPDDDMRAEFVGPHCPNPSDPAIENSIAVLAGKMLNCTSIEVR